MSDLELGPGWVEALRAAHDFDVPPALRARLRRELPAPLPRSIPLAVGLLGLIVVQHGFGNVVIGRWIADQTHGHYDPHMFREAAIATVGVGMLLLLAAVRRRWLAPASVVGVPVGLAFGIQGATEINETVWGFALHSMEGVLAVALAYLWWRYARRRKAEEGA